MEEYNGYIYFESPDGIEVYDGHGCFLGSTASVKTAQSLIDALGQGDGSQYNGGY